MLSPGASCLWAPPEPGPDSVVGNTEVGQNPVAFDICNMLITIYSELKSPGVSKYVEGVFFSDLRG